MGGGRNYEKLFTELDSAVKSFLNELGLSTKMLDDIARKGQDYYLGTYKATLKLDTINKLLNNLDLLMVSDNSVKISDNNIELNSDYNVTDFRVGYHSINQGSEFWTNFDMLIQNLKFQKTHDDSNGIGEFCDYLIRCVETTQKEGYEIAPIAQEPELPQESQLKFEPKIMVDISEVEKQDLIRIQKYIKDGTIRCV